MQIDQFAPLLGDDEIASVVETLKSNWITEGAKTRTLEGMLQDYCGVKHAIMLPNGTLALFVALKILDVGPGDEVVVPAFTFVGSATSVVLTGAKPVFCDINLDDFNINIESLESVVSERTKAIMPVHIYGMPCDMDPINAIARKHKLTVVEDACQAWLAEYKGRKCGTLGDLGCFSFQESKHIPSGEGGAITGMSEQLIDKCNSYHNCGRACGTNTGKGSFTRGNNYRMTQVQAVLLLQQIDKLIKETAIRQANADYLNSQLGKIPGITPVRLPENAKAVWHIFPFRYNSSEFNGLPREKFLKALSAEGVPCGSMYTEQYFDGLLDEAIASRGFQRLWSKERLKAYRDSLNELNGNKQVCATTVGFTQNLLLGSRRDMDDILEAIQRIQTHRAALV